MAESIDDKIDLAYIFGKTEISIKILNNFMACFKKVFGRRPNIIGFKDRTYAILLHLENIYVIIAPLATDGQLFDNTCDLDFVSIKNGEIIIENGVKAISIQEFRNLMKMNEDDIASKYSIKKNRKISMIIEIIKTSEYGKQRRVKTSKSLF